MKTNFHRIVFTVLAIAILAAAADVKPVGVIQSIDPGAKKIVLKTDSGPEMDVVLEDATTYVRIKPGEKDLSNAQPLKLEELAKGDRILVQGSPAKRVIVMSQSDVAAKHAADRADWERNGILGTVESLDAANNKLVVKTRMGMTTKPVEVTVPQNAAVRRYTPDSVKFSDAKPSSLVEVKVGDQVRARGQKSADSSTLAAEELVAGTFRTIAVTVDTVDAVANSLKVKDLDTKKSVVVKLGPDSSVRRMPEMMARFMANSLNSDSSPRPGGAAGGPVPQGAPGQGMLTGAAGGPGGPGGFRGGGGSMIERMPQIKLDELKSGDALIISAPEGTKSGEINAIMLVAGVEPLLTTPSKRQVMLGNWSLDTGGGMAAGMGQ
jgi:hypothetical protein